jgi:hypothetical protein
MACRLREKEFSMTHGPRYAVLLGCFAALTLDDMNEILVPLLREPGPDAN